MTSFEELPWNPLPQNGQTVFFTEEVYVSLLGVETHETRLEQRLKKVGIHLNTLAQKNSNKPFSYIIEQQSSQGSVSLGTKGKTVKTIRGESFESTNENEGNISEETFTALKIAHHFESKTSKILDKTEEGSENSSTSDFRPKSFYSEFTENENMKTVTDLEASKCPINEEHKFQHKMSRASKNLEEPVFYKNTPIESDQKPIKFADLDQNFYNIRDRNDKDRYTALIFCKKPYHRKSQFSVSQQRLYMDLFRQYGTLLNTDFEEGNNAEFNRFKKLTAEVKKEQGAFQQYLKTTSQKCKKDYEYVHPEVKKYVSAKLLSKRRRVLSYPRHYKHVKMIALDDDVGDDPPPTLKHVRPLLQLGVAKKLLLPNILPGLPQPCTPTNFKKINEIDPAIRDNYTGPYVWSNEVCSQDVNAEQLAVPNLCNVVMSASVVKYLIDNQGNSGKHWEMPITVREYQIGVGEKSFIHRVAFIDKPIIRTTEFTPKDQNQLYQKHAIPAVAFRQRQKGYSFIRAKPVHSVVKAPAAEDIENELQSYEKHMKENMKNEPVGDFHEGKIHVSKGKKTRRKKRKGKQEKGMFAAVQEIDDLETFGMDVQEMKEKPENKSPKTKGVKSPMEEKETIMTEESSTETSSFVKRKKLRLSADTDLEKLKLELQGIKTKAQNDAEKSHLASQHMLSPTKTNAALENTLEIAGTSKTDVKDVSKRSSSGWSNILMTEIEKPSVTETVYKAEKKTKSKQEKMCSAKTQDVENDSVTTVNQTTETDATNDKASVSTTKTDPYESKERQTIFENKIGEAEVVGNNEFSLNKADNKTRKNENDQTASKDNIRLKEDDRSNTFEDNAIKNEVKRAKYQVINQNQKDVKSKKLFEESKEIYAKDFESDSDNDELVIDLPEDVSLVRPERMGFLLSTVKPEVPGTEIVKEVQESNIICNARNTEIEESDIDFKNTNKKPGVEKEMIETDSEIENSQTVVKKLQKNNDSKSGANVKIGKNEQSNNENLLKVTTRASKRLSSTNLQEHSTPSKRTLRSSGGKTDFNETDLDVTPGRKTRCSASKAEKMDTTTDEIKQEPIETEFVTPVTIHGRGRQKAGTQRGSTSRSRSASCESRQTKEDITTLRNSSSESPATPENSVDSSVQVKRKRGRPKKSAQTNEEETDNPMTAIQSKTHIKAETDNTEKTDVDGASNKTKIKYGQKMSMKESSTSDLASFEGKETSHYPDTGIANGSEKKEKRREVHVNYKSCSDDEGGGLVIDEGEDDAAEKNEKLQNADLKKPVRKRSKTGDITETDEDDSLDKELNSPKRKGIPKITDSDEDVQDNPIIKSSSASKCVQGKQLKRKSADSKLAKDEEAEKIKAMADAMKKKIEERKLESESKKAKTVSQVCTDRDKITSVKDVPSTVKTHDDKNDSSTSFQGTDKPSSSNLSLVVQDSKSTTQTLKNQTMQPPSRESSSANEPPNKESISCEQVQFGVDSILQSSEFRPRADALKGSVIETLAAQHGMSHIALPIDDNVTYHHWTLGDINALIRVKYHGFMQNQGLVHIAPKMEYQPIFGYERETLNEVAKNWASIYVRPNSSLVRCRVNAFNSEIMKIEAVQFQDLVPPESLFCPKQAFADLDMILQQIKSLSVGQYLVRNNPKKETMNIMKAVTEPDSTSYDLHLAHTTLMMSKVNKPPVVQWLPIDTRHLLPHHRKLNLIPCTFPPPDMGPVEKKKFQRKKKKKSKNKQKP